MVLRAYLLVSVRDECKKESFPQAVKEIEALDEVDFADPVVGDADLVVMVETDNIEQTAEKVAAMPCTENVSVLRICSALERHRTLRQELLQKLAD
jgi:hypothetical protein